MLRKNKFIPGIKEIIKFSIEFNKYDVYLCAGLHRSGSTWLYNAARLILQSEYPQTGAGWIGDWNSIGKNQRMLVKVHDLNTIAIKRAKIVLYSYRDLREIVRSMYAKFNSIPSEELIRDLILLDKKWRKRAHFVMKYEDMINNPKLILEKLAIILSIQNVNYDQIIEELNNMSYNSIGSKNETYHFLNLMHQGHRTSQVKPINQELVKDINALVERVGKRWLNDNKYE